jgi:hypothetical protein
MKRLLGLLLCGGAAGAALCAQAGGNVSSVVSDPSGSAIPGAVLILKRSAMQSVRVAKANSVGLVGLPLWRRASTMWPHPLPDARPRRLI